MPVLHHSDFLQTRDSKSASTYRAGGKTLKISFIALQQLLYHLQVAFNKQIESLCMAHDQQLVKSIHRNIHIPATTIPSSFGNPAERLLLSCKIGQQLDSMSTLSQILIAPPPTTFGRVLI